MVAYKDVSDAQDPFLPILPDDELAAPSFLDSQACFCRLVSSDTINQGAATWQCMGNQTKDDTRGKFYPAKDPSVDVTTLKFDDFSNPPDTNQPFTYDKGSQNLVAGNGKLDIFDNACTGVKSTQFTTSLHRAMAASSKDQIPIDAVPCLRRGAAPMRIQDPTQWLKVGCLDGFQCK